MNKTLANSVLVFVAGASYGFIVPVIKVAVDNGIYPASFLPMQYFAALIICLIVMAITRTRFAGPGALARMALLGIFTGSTSICYYTAVSLLPSAVALTLLFQYVWVDVLIECIMEKRPPDKISIISVAIVLVGTVFAAGLLDGTFGVLDPVGVAFGAASALFYALFLYFSGIIGKNEPMVLRTTMLTVGGLIITSLVNPMSYTTSFIDPSVWPFAIGLSLIGILCPTALINYASPKLSTGMVSIMASSELPVGVLAAWALVNDVPTPLVLIGAILVLAGIAVKQLPELLRRNA